MNWKYFKKIFRTIGLILAILIGFMGFYAVTRAEIEPKAQIINTLPDISGLGWIENNLFLGVHDAKNGTDNDKPRVSLIKLPDSKSGLGWEPVDLIWPEPIGFSNDLEGVARIPDEFWFIIAESGNNLKTPPFPRLFLLEYAQNQLKLIDSTSWPVPVNNVEGIAVAKIKNQLIFIYAERGDNQPNTEIRWGSLSLNPLKFGSFGGVIYPNPESKQTNIRSVSAMDVDNQGRLYVASAFDPNVDNGPFYSKVWQIGKISEQENNDIQIILESTPKLIAVIDGFKVEGLAIKETNGNQREFIIGTDDENYGGVVRILPLN
ncbi:conserved hypothetical protein [Gloeothece citriformis PCC 7424]|uniref:Phytase-like domain-containing protein n=1 Tax=Gloeothece citriformis (strain PCC 7424) TaxID=65393 RepID=B7KE62_GLOC7|nr:hypothetical protein [Gloeothece citriformis]ACK71760.1 conserved hypothetical protein [Gloeothece citriformis PCC 7424]